MSPQRRNSLLLQLAAFVALSMSEGTIDTMEPIYRVAPLDLNAEGYFSYSIVLHHVDAVTTASSFSDYLSSARLVIMVAAKLRLFVRCILCIYTCSSKLGRCDEY